MKLRKCSKCGVEKELSPEHFHRSKRAALGFGYACKPCKLAAKKLWVAANPDKVKEHKRIYYAKYPHKIIERKKRWREKNPEKWKAQLRRQRAARKVRDPELYAAKRSAEKQRARERLTDDYIRGLIVNFSSLSRKDIPQGLIEAKRVHLMLKRAVKQLEENK